ncbi:MAG TPA: hypothetical protein DEQ47_11715 [Solibacterales bacterium]|nr:hypothetical protein [Bryobacterales bacterium]
MAAAALLLQAPFRTRPVETLPTGILGVDQLIAGVPRRALTEICGPDSSGRTSLFISLLAQATRRGEYCALVDAGDSFDPQSAARAGVHLPQLLWIRCGGGDAHGAAERALKAADLIVQAGGFGLIGMDLGDLPDAAVRRISLASWFRLRHAVERTNAALVALERQINARSCSALQIAMRRKETFWSGRLSGRLLDGFGVELENRKHYRAQTTGFEARW